MWSHYAYKHEGICIEYDFKDFIKNKPNNIILKRVNYVEEIINDRNSILTSKDNSQDRLIDILSIKSKEWEYENEYRIIKYCKDNNSNTIKLPIKNIYFGTKTSQYDKDLLIKILSDKNIEFYQANFDNNIINKIIFTKIK